MLRSPSSFENTNFSLRFHLLTTQKRCLVSYENAFWNILKVERFENSQHYRFGVDG